MCPDIWAVLHQRRPPTTRSSPAPSWGARACRRAPGSERCVGTSDDRCTQLELFAEALTQLPAAQDDPAQPIPVLERLGRYSGSFVVGRESRIARPVALWVYYGGVMVTARGDAGSVGA